MEEIQAVDEARSIHQNQTGRNDQMRIKGSEFTDVALFVNIKYRVVVGPGPSAVQTDENSAVCFRKEASAERVKPFFHNLSLPNPGDLF